MTREHFQSLLSKATQDVLGITREFVSNKIPETFVYRIHLNQSYDREPDGNILTSFPEDSESAQNGGIFSKADEVVDLLLRNGSVPAWINVQIDEVEDERTIIELICCGRFTAEEERMYYTRWEMGPFGVKGPAIPPWFDTLQNRQKVLEQIKQQKFDLHWRKKMSK